MFKTVIRNSLKANTKKNLSIARDEQKGMALLKAAKDSYPAISKEDVRTSTRTILSSTSIFFRHICIFTKQSLLPKNVQSN
ncbi:hypothetical protein [Viridibacillus sp. FSL H8-0123]|uniref:hypothetical protein n=1 Tax=Viridibacillus sp. FSL H8-0123 TaxID=1928922 RepID=UPI00096BF8BB|nr:hypothetical protein [Viridibacillus sp. FSL H8-0123]OMC77696.1 hypothetical protein BK130_21485 [Viridibacillus sp. FSL H8-0123]